MTHSKECRYPFADMVSHRPVSRWCSSYPIIPSVCQLRRPGTASCFVSERRNSGSLHYTTDSYMTQMTSVFITRTGCRPRYSGIGRFSRKLSPCVGKNTTSGRGRTFVRARLCRHARPVCVAEKQPPRLQNEWRQSGTAGYSRATGRGKEPPGSEPAAEVFTPLRCGDSLPGASAGRCSPVGWPPGRMPGT